MLAPSVAVTRHHRTAARVRADKDPPSRCGRTHVATDATRACRIVFGDIGCIDAQAAGLVGDVLHELPMSPLAEALVLMATFVWASGHLPHIADGEVCHPLRLCELDHLAAGLVQDVTRLTREAG